jgi:hypothetical protein
MPVNESSVYCALLSVVRFVAICIVAGEFKALSKSFNSRALVHKTMAQSYLIHHSISHHSSVEYYHETTISTHHQYLPDLTITRVVALQAEPYLEHHMQHQYNIVHSHHSHDAHHASLE